MRIKSRWLVILLVLGMVVAACGGDGEAEDTTTTAGDDVTTTEGETDTTEDDGTDTTMGDGDGEMEIATDVGVDLEAQTITVGLLSDLTGPFGPLVTAIVAGHEAYWANVNANGGINGMEVQLEIVDTTYDVPTHVQLYEELKDEVVAFGHSTGSPHTVAIREQLEEDGILAIPLTWYSGWSDPALNANLVPHGTPYCIESQNLIQYMVEQSGIDSPTLAIASQPGDYGLDSMAGAEIAAEALGLEIVYDGSGAILPGDETTYDEVAAGIVESGADLVYVTTSPTPYSSIYGRAVAQGFEATWSGAAPSWNPAFVAEDSAIRDAITRDMIISFYLQGYDGDSEGAAEVRELMGDAPPTDYYGEGFVEAKILHEALLAAYDAGDMTQTGVLNAAKSLESVEFNGLAPTESYVGDPNDIVQRQINIFRPDPSAPTGTVLVEENYTSEIAAEFTFDGACFVLEG